MPRVNSIIPNQVDSASEIASWDVNKKDQR